MIRREHLDEDRKRVEAFRALAHPAGADETGVEESVSPMLITHDGAVIDDSPPEEDILDGLDRAGLDPRDAEGAER